MLLGPLAIAAFSPLPSVLRGAIAGATAVGIPMLLWFEVVQSTGTSPQMMGDQAEQWTSDEVRGLRRRGWRVLHHLVLWRSDIDHLLVGPNEIIVIETKWSADWSDSWHTPRLEEAVRQVRAGARSLRLWQPVKATAIEVRPVLVLWGGGVENALSKLNAPDDVTVMAGRDLKSWLRSFESTGPWVDRPERMWRELVLLVEKQDACERQHGGSLTSPLRVAVEAYWMFVAATLGVVAVAEMTALSESLTLGTAVGLGALVSLGACARAGLWPRFLWAAAVGAGIPGVLSLLAYLVVLLG